jgi:hypothetical protein
MIVRLKRITHGDALGHLDRQLDRPPLGRAGEAPFRRLIGPRSDHHVLAGGVGAGGGADAQRNQASLLIPRTETRLRAGESLLQMAPRMRARCDIPSQGHAERHRLPGEPPESLDDHGLPVVVRRLIAAEGGISARDLTQGRTADGRSGQLVGLLAKC